MAFLKHSSALLLFVLHTISLSAQSAKPDYSLLWEVSGKDLPKPCYFFGTMHLRDERVFELCDSVLLAIERCEAFAMEVHPDSAMSYALQIALSEDSSDMKLDQMLEEKGIDETDLMRKERMASMMDSLKAKKPQLLENFFKDFKDLPFAKKRPQILDLTLFAYAQGRGKQMDGLELMSEYKDLSNAFFGQLGDSMVVKAKPFSMNNFIEAYRQGNTEKVYDMVVERIANSNYRKEILTNRNQRMVQKMVSLGRERSIFCAVGVAHLPGDDGVLALLRQQGYQVRRVQAEFTGISDSLLLANQIATKSIEFTDAHSAYSAVVPTMPLFQRIDQNLAEPGEKPSMMTGRMNISSDLPQGRQYIMMTLDYPPSLVFDDKKLLFDAVEVGYEEQWGRKTRPSTDILVDGLPGRSMTYRMKGNMVNVQVTMRGNRFYAFSAVHPVGTKDSLSDLFFQSVHLIPFSHTPLRKTQLPEMGSVAAFPGKVEFTSDTSSMYQFPSKFTLSYSAGDSLSASTYTVQEVLWSKYFKPETPDSFLLNYGINLGSDSLYTVVDTVFKSMPAYYYFEKDTLNLKYMDHLLMMTDTGVYQLLVNRSSLGDEARTWEFFHSFEPKRTWTGALLKRDVLPMLLENLQSQDSVTAEEARYALGEQTFTKDDLPAILAVLNQPMPWDTMEWSSAHVTLLRKLEGMKDERVLPFLKAYFPKNPGYALRQSQALEVMLSLQSKEAYAAFFELAPTIDTTGGTDISLWGINGYFNNDSSLVLENLPALFELRKHPSYQNIVYDAFENCMTSDSTNLPLFLPYSAELMKAAWDMAAAEQLFSYKDSLPDGLNLWPFNSLVSIIGHLPPSSGSVDFLRKMLAVPERWLHNNVLTALFRQGETVDKSVLDKVYKDPFAWHDLLSSFDDERFLQKIPKKLLDVEHFMEGGIPTLFYEEDLEGVEAFKVLEKRKYTHKGEEMLLYVFSCHFEYDEETSYLGICTQPKSGKLSIHPHIYDVSYTPYDGENREEIISEILANYEEADID